MHPKSGRRRVSSPGLGVGRIGLDRVIAGAGIDLGIGGSIDGVDLVIAIVAKELIRPETADNAVVAGAAVERVRAAPTNDGVSAPAAIAGRGKRRAVEVYIVVPFARLNGDLLDVVESGAGAVHGHIYRTS